MTKSKIVLWIAFAYLMGSCECGVNPSPSFSIAYLFYRNSKSEDLLDANTQGHFDRNAITITSNGKTGTPEGGKILAGTGYIQMGFPEGYFVNLPLVATKTDIIISLNSTISDTLSYAYSGNKLITCIYNKRNVLPANAAIQFPVVIIK